MLVDAIDRADDLRGQFDIPRDLEDDLGIEHRRGMLGEQEAFGDIDEGQRRADQAIDANVDKGVEDDLGRGLFLVNDPCLLLDGTGTIKQLVAEDLEIAV